MLKQSVIKRHLFRLANRSPIGQLEASTWPSLCSCDLLFHGILSPPMMHWGTWPFYSGLQSVSLSSFISHPRRVFLHRRKRLQFQPSGGEKHQPGGYHALPPPPLHPRPSPRYPIAEICGSSGKHWFQRLKKESPFQARCSDRSPPPSRPPLPPTHGQWKHGSLRKDSRAEMRAGRGGSLKV